MSKELKEFPGGLIIPEREIEDFFMGAKEREIGGAVRMELPDYRPFVPTPEFQKKRYLDDYGCVTHSAQNVLEVDLIYNIKEGGDVFIKDILSSLEMLDKHGLPDFSDRFNVLLSGTIPYVGNSPRNVAESLRKDGMIPEKDLSFPEDIRQEQYFSRVPEIAKQKGKEFLKYFKIKWEWVGSALSHARVSPKKRFEALKKGAVTVCVDSRSPSLNGLIQPPRGTGYNYNHQECLIYAKWGEYWITYNSYRRIIKTYTWHYRFAYDMRLSIELYKNPDTVRKFLKKNNGKFVKGSGSAIYMIDGNTKRPFLHWFEYLAFDGGKGKHKRVDDVLLSMVSEGEPMRIEESPYWNFLKDHYELLKGMSAPDNIKRLETILKEKEEDKPKDAGVAINKDPLEWLKNIFSFLKK